MEHASNPAIASVPLNREDDPQRVVSMSEAQEVVREKRFRK